MKWFIILTFFLLGDLAAETDSLSETDSQSNSASDLVEKPMIKYELKNLISKQSSFYVFKKDDKIRHYYKFKNQDGMHYIIYEENTTLASLKEINYLRQFLLKPNQSLKLKIECKQKAFCTGTCANKYYQISNTQNPVIAKSNNCQLTYVSFAEKPIVDSKKLLQTSSIEFAPANDVKEK